MQDPQVNRAFSKALKAACDQFQTGQVDQFHETIALLSFREAGVSIVLANPELPDCPIIGVSDGFRKMTGYTRSESLGQNCRFLNYGCPMKADTRHALRIAVRIGKTHVCVLTNRRRYGDQFQNLFHMSSIRIGHKFYLIGVQADVTHSDVDLSKASHVAELNMVVDRIFSENVNAWIAFQDKSFSMSRIGRPIPYTQSMLKPKYESSEYSDARSVFVSLEGNLHQSAEQTCTKNTFLETFNESDSREALCLLRKVSSEPMLRSQQTFLGDEDEVPRQVPELQQYQHQQYKKFQQVRESEEENEDEEDHQQQWQLQQERKLQMKIAQHEPPPAVSGDSSKSIGSMFHPDQCTPCSFYCYSLMGCNRGSQCEYCHEDHPKKARRRGKKKRRGQGSSADMDAFIDEGTQGQEAEDVRKPAAQRIQEDKDAETRPPAPTPELLLPLLTALEFLAPLPLPFLVPRETKSGAGYPNQFGETSSCTPGDFYQISSKDPALLPKLSMRYHESSFTLQVGDEKHLIPFLTANGDLQGPELEPLTFTVHPELPEGFHLDPASGVIKGKATKPTSSAGYRRHTVTAVNGALSSSTKVNIMVRPSGFWDAKPIPATEHDFSADIVTSDWLADCQDCSFQADTMMSTDSSWLRDSPTFPLQYTL
eukprot:gnl/MRDRNA2_/MRDRNA2_135128_c0_seq1.p1 gnl/MRDRNA2_/MRDRNA2_135128_c0~~gnl/MRDRNA2_/MRDRNA2_135128_c0_seq1.p1  ORF type:complete len:652 (+),score=108.37 gnl/MRDRNA2_/MRDRNA2_135128_c0_seq1:370-2325(+)